MDTAQASFGKGWIWEFLMAPPAVGWPLDASAALGVFYFPDG